MKSGKKSIYLLIFILIISSLTACLPTTSNPIESQNVNLPNPASQYCTEQGYQLEMRQNEAGEYGVCIFPDGTECDEWAYFRGECAPGNSQDQEIEDMEETDQTEKTGETNTTYPVYALYGSIQSSGTSIPAESILNTYLDSPAPIYITGETGEIEAQILDLQDKEEPSNQANFWGRLDCPTMDNCLFTVSKLRIDGPGEFLPPDTVEAWQGVIINGPEGPRSGGDDYFVLNGDIPFQYGIQGETDSIQQQIDAFRDANTPVKIWGQLYAGRPDWQGTQIIVTRIEAIE